MKNRQAMWTGALLLLAAGCTNHRGIGKHHEESAEREEAAEREGAEAGEESEEMEMSGEAAPASAPAISLAEAIRLARARAEGFTAVAAGMEGEEADGYRVALLSHGRVKEIVVDATNGKLGEVKERAVHAGREEFAAKLEALMPAAKIDLQHAVEIALARAAGGSALGAQIDLEDGKLTYHVTVLASGKGMEFTIDPATGALQVEEGAREEEHEEAGEEAGEDEMHEATGEVMFQEEYEHALGITARASFDDIPAGGLPEGWKIEGTAQKGPLATWKVVADDAAPSKGNVLALTSTNHDSGSTFNLCWTDKIRFKDGAIEVSIKPVSGKDDQGGGLIWRAKDKDDYYICRANPLESNFRVYYVKDGSRHQLASAKAEIKAGAWHKIRVEQKGDHIACSLDGKRLLEATDSTFPDEGGVGLWTKSDAVSSFDELQVSGAKGGKDEDGDEDDEKDEKR